MRVVEVDDAVRQARRAVDALLADALRARVCARKEVPPNRWSAGCLACGSDCNLVRGRPRSVTVDTRKRASQLTLTLTKRVARGEVRVLDLAKVLRKALEASTPRRTSFEDRGVCGGGRRSKSQSQERATKQRQELPEAQATGIRFAYPDPPSWDEDTPIESCDLSEAPKSAESPWGEAAPAREVAAAARAAAKENEKRIVTRVRGCEEACERERGREETGRQRERQKRTSAFRGGRGQGKAMDRKTRANSTCCEPPRARRRKEE